MTSVPDSFLCEQLGSDKSAEAFAFHQKFLSSAGPYLWPRDSDQIKKFAEIGELFGVRQMTGSLVGLCYATELSQEEARQINLTGWELGGVTVEKTAQRRGLGALLVRFALGHTILNQRPWFNRQEIVTLVHEENQKPLSVLKQLGFEKRGQVEFPNAPETVRRNDAGKVIADKYIFPHSAVRELHRWFNNFRGDLGDGSDVRFSIPPADVSRIIEALQEAIQELGAAARP